MPAPKGSWFLLLRGAYIYFRYSVQEMGDALKSLKRDHDKAFAFAEQARSSLLDVQELRPTVQESMTRMSIRLVHDSVHSCLMPHIISEFEGLFDGNGDFALHKEIMAPISDLRMEYTQCMRAALHFLLAHTNKIGHM